MYHPHKLNWREISQRRNTVYSPHHNVWCPGPESNWHALRREILNLSPSAKALHSNYPRASSISTNSGTPSLARLAITSVNKPGGASGGFGSTRYISVRGRAYSNKEAAG